MRLWRKCRLDRRSSAGFRSIATVSSGQASIAAERTSDKSLVSDCASIPSKDDTAQGSIRVSSGGADGESVLASNVRSDRRSSAGFASVSGEIPPKPPYSREDSSIKPSSGSRSKLIGDLRACAAAKDLAKGKNLHAEAVRKGIFGGIYLENTVVDMYAKCSKMIDATIVFDAMQDHTVVSWNILLMGYVDNGDPELALDNFSSSMDCEPDPWTLVAAIKACSSLIEIEAGESSITKISRTTKVGGIVSSKNTALERGMFVHSRVLRCGDVFISTALVDMYAKCGSMEDAHRIFDLMPCHSVVSWNSLIQGYVQSSDGGMALLVFAEMRHRGCAANSLTYTAAIKACRCLAAIEEGKQIDGKMLKLKSLEKGKILHSQAANAGFEFDLLIGSSLADLYAKCGSLVDASRIFDRIQMKTVVSWNALLLGYTENGEDHLALELFARMQDQGCIPDSRTYVAAVKACSGLAAKESGILIGEKLVKISSLEKLMKIHSQSTNSGHDRDNYVGNTLIDAYAKCGSIRDARTVFDQMLHHGVVSWTALILGYVEAGEEDLTLELFDRMKATGVRPNARTFVAAVKACTGLASKELGQKVDGRRKLVKSEFLSRGLAIHAEASDNLCEIDSFVASSLVNLYATCGSLADARSVFDRIPKPDTVLWNVLMLGYVENGEAELALHFYSSTMQHTGCKPDCSTFVVALKACAALADVKDARSVHGDILRLQGLDRNRIGEGFLDSLVDVYGKCGSMIEAQQAFDLIPQRDLQTGTWNSLLAGFARQGDAERIFGVFQKMRDEGFEPDSITLNCILSGCSHAGLVETGLKFFRAMEQRFGISPDVEHYTCVVDMLGRSNKLTAALEVVSSIPSRVDPVVWMTLLTSCWKWKNLAIGRIAFDAVMMLGDNEKIDAAYNLMANLYSSSSQET